MMFTCAASLEDEDDDNNNNNNGEVSEPTQRSSSVASGLLLTACAVRAWDGAGALRCHIEQTGKKKVTATTVTCQR